MLSLQVPKTGMMDLLYFLTVRSVILTSVPGGKYLAGITLKDAPVSTCMSIGLSKVSVVRLVSLVLSH